MSARMPLYVFVCALMLALFLPSRASAADIYVPAGGDLQAALDAARPGDTIRLQAGATFVGNFSLPVHGGSDYVTIRSSASDALLPPAGTRISPAYAAQLPKIRSPNSVPALATRPGAAYWRLLCLEFQATHLGYYDIITLGDGSQAQHTLSSVPQHLILDRLYVHGDPLHGQKRGVALNSGTTTLINSWISDIKAVGQDSQAAGGWNGPGPYTIENNYLEAAGEVFLLGGSDPAIPNLVTADVVLRNNTLTRPLDWRNPIVPAPTGVTGTALSGGSLPAGTYRYRVVARRPVNASTASSPASEDVPVTVAASGRARLTWTAVPSATEYRVYGLPPDGETRYWTVTGTTTFIDDGAQAGTSGSPPSATLWQVKNILELKNARRVRIERNVLSNNWAQAQVGVAVLFTPRNQDGRCPWCVVEDIDFEYNVVQGVGAGITILGWDNERPSQQTNGIRIRHNRFLDFGRSWGGTGYFMHIMGEPRDVVIDHNTIISADARGVIAVDGPPITGFVFTNNLALHHAYGIIGTNRGPGLGSISHFFPDGVVTRNVFAENVERYGYPPGNEFPSAETFRANFADYDRGLLRSGTTWERAGTDGQDLGANGPPGSSGLPPRPPGGVRVDGH